ncbi:hypothetical protein ACFSUK_08960 [Sphingobium scionense]
MGAWLGGMVGPRRMAVRSERARRNLALLRPDLSEGDAAALLHQRWRNVGTLPPNCRRWGDCLPAAISRSRIMTPIAPSSMVPARSSSCRCISAIGM